MTYHEKNREKKKQQQQVFTLSLLCKTKALHQPTWKMEEKDEKIDILLTEMFKYLWLVFFLAMDPLFPNTHRIICAKTYIYGSHNVVTCTAD